MSSDAAPEQHSSADGYLQRAQLLAELGRYDEAAGELGFALALDPADASALIMLARVHLVAGRPEEALAVVDTLLAAAPGQVQPLVLRGLALADLRRFGEAAEVAEELLTFGPDDAYATRCAALILAEARNGQAVLNTAWRGVELAPEEPQAHLVLALVATRLHLFDLAERAYREALRLDPRLAEAGHDVGAMRLERNRCARALERLAEEVALRLGPGEAPRAIAGDLRRLVLYGAGYSLVAAVAVAFLASGNDALSRIMAVVLALVGGGVVWGYATRVPRPVTALLRGLLRTDRTLALSVYVVATGPCLILLYALVGTPWPLVLAIAATAAAELAVLTRPRA